MKWFGLCTLCETEVFDVEQRYGSRMPEPYNRLPMRIGKPHENAVRATLQLSNDTECDLTFCRDCLDGIESKAPAVWAKCMEAMIFENSHRKELGADTDPELVARANQQIAELCDVRIISFLRVEPWQSLA